MSGSSGFTVSRSHGGDRFYNPPAIRRYQQQQLLLQEQQQQQLHHPHQLLTSSMPETSGDGDTCTDSEESTFTKSVITCNFPQSPSNLTTNLDRLMKSVTPSVPAQYISEGNVRVRRNRENDLQSFFILGDLWDSFKEWSVYGVGVPLWLNENDSVKQYYVPSLSGMQLYIDPPKPSSSWRPSEESDSESSVDVSSRIIVYGSNGQQNHAGSNYQKLSRLSLRDKSVKSSSSDESDASDSTGQLLFEYLEQEQPHFRKPLTDKISVLASQFPEVRNYRSCDLFSSSWFSVAWYPIYRIPMGPTLQNLDASFLTFHSLSTRYKSRAHPLFHTQQNVGRRTNKSDSFLKIPLPIFGLASYKLKGSILTPSGDHECGQETSLFEAAHNWLDRMHVDLPDYRFFRSHNSHWR